MNALSPKPSVCVWKAQVQNWTHAAHMYVRYMQRTTKRTFLGCSQIALFSLILPAIQTPQFTYPHHALRVQPHRSVASSPVLSRRLYEAPNTITKAPKWGFIIYRCDYQSDDAWNDFINSWATLVKEELQTSYKDGGLLLQTLKFTVRDDRSSLEGASVEKVRTLHMAWAESGESVAEQAEIAKTRTHYCLARYSYCIHVDSAALNSCLKYFAVLQSRKAASDKLCEGYWVAENNAYVNLVSILYPRPINEEETQAEAEEEGWGLVEDAPVCIKANLPAVLPEMYGEVGNGFSLWAQEIRRDPNSVFQL